MLDIFSNNAAFTITGLTVALLRTPYIPGLIGRLGLFTPRPIATTTTTIEIKGTRLALVPEVPRGAPPIPNVEDHRALVPFRIPHFPIRDTIMADAVQNVRSFGSEDTLEALSSVRNERLASMGLKLDVTQEFLRLGSVRGVIVTAADRTTGAPLTSISLFDQFEVAPQANTNWPIIGAGGAGESAAWEGQLTGLINALGRAMAEEVPGGMMGGIFGVCGPVFFDAFAMHPERRAAYIGIDSRPVVDPLLGSRVQFRDVTIEEYRGRTNNVAFVAPNQCHFFPVGVPDLFIEVFAPADYNETVNTLGLARYAKMEEMQFDKGVELEAQMNVLPICTSPRALFTVTATPYVASTATAPPPNRRS
jgi:hypothetical protein